MSICIMDETKKQECLLSIVETWNLSEKPEFRGFRCANCQEYITDKAWHYFLNTSGYLTPVHFCDGCKAKFEEGTIAATKQRIGVDRKKFRPVFTASTEIALDQISGSWDAAAEPVYKVFTCDNCGGPLLNAEGYHVWRNKEGTLIEYHLDRDCGAKILGV